MTLRGTVLRRALLTLVAAGCSPPSGEESDAPRAALLTSGPVSDAGWNAGAYEGLMLIGDSLGLRISHQQTRTPAELDDAYISYAEDGYGLIFGHGFEYQDAASRAAPRYPETTFVVSSGFREDDNLLPLIFGLEEASFLAGIAAGGVTRAGVVGMVGGVEIPTLKATFAAFRAGVLRANPDARVLETFLGSWDDAARAKEAAAAQLSQGADVLIHNVDAASFGVFQAVRESALERPSWAFGMNRNQNDVAPDVVLGSAVIDIPRVFLSVAQAWLNGDVRPALEVGLAGGTVDFIPNPDLEGVIDAETQALIAEARREILEDGYVVPGRLTRENLIEPSSSLDSSGT